MRIFAALGMAALLGLLSFGSEAAGLPVVISATVDYTHNTLTISGQNFGSNPSVTLDALAFSTPSGASTGTQIVANFPSGKAPSSFTPGTYFLTVTFKNQLPTVFGVDIGANGAVGPAGPGGTQGSPGVAGPTGPAGPVGVQGVPGPFGPAGATGPVGAAGAQGLQGVAGAAGPVGPQGLQGAAGVAGATGPQGPAGPPGASGSASTGGVLVVTDGGGTVVGPFVTDGSAGSVIVADSNGILLAVALTPDASSSPIVFGLAALPSGTDVFHASLDCSGPRLTYAPAVGVFASPALQTSSGIYYVDPTTSQHIPQFSPGSLENVNPQAFDLPGSCTPLPQSEVQSLPLLGALVKLNPAALVLSPPFYVHIR
jgi:Collagen triple helix repeat (20 copies)